MIKAVLFIEVEPRWLGDSQAMAIFNRAAELEAEQHGYKIIGEPEVTDPERGPNKLLVWTVQTPA